MPTGVQFIGNLRASPQWAADFGGREHILPVPAKVDVAQFTDAAAVTVVTSGAAAGATSVPVTALTPSVLANTTLIANGNVLIPSGTVLYFGGAKVAQLTADAVIGATTLTVAALPTLLAASDTARYSAFNQLFIPSGTVIGRTYAEAQANTAYGMAASTDDEIFCTMFDVTDARQNNDVELYRHNSLVRENYLPGYGATGALGTSGAPTALLTKLRTLYRCIQGVN